MGREMMGNYIVSNDKSVIIVIRGIIAQMTGSLFGVRGTSLRPSLALGPEREAGTGEVLEVGALACGKAQKAGCVGE